MLVNPIAPIIASEPWQVEAACIEVGPVPFETLPGGISDLNRQALSICAGCTVRQECLDFAMRIEGDVRTSARACIYGGRTPAQRAALAAKRSTPTSSLPLCRDCERPMRPPRTRVADWPGTTVRWSADQCQTCAKKEKRREKAA